MDRLQRAHPESDAAGDGARLATMRRWVTAAQAVFGRLGVEIGALHAFDAEDEPLFDRLEEQVHRLLASIDAAASGMGCCSTCS